MRGRPRPPATKEQRTEAILRAITKVGRSVDSGSESMLASYLLKPKAFPTLSLSPQGLAWITMQLYKHFSVVLLDATFSANEKVAKEYKIPGMYVELLHANNMEEVKSPNAYTRIRLRSARYPDFYNALSNPRTSDIDRLQSLVEEYFYANPHTALFLMSSNVQLFIDPEVYFETGETRADKSLFDVHNNAKVLLQNAIDVFLGFKVNAATFTIVQSGAKQLDAKFDMNKDVLTLEFHVTPDFVDFNSEINIVSMVRRIAARFGITEDTGTLLFKTNASTYVNAVHANFAILKALEETLPSPVVTMTNMMLSAVKVTSLRSSWEGRNSAILTIAHLFKSKATALGRTLGLVSKPRVSMLKGANFEQFDENALYAPNVISDTDLAKLSADNKEKMAREKEFTKYDPDPWGTYAADYTGGGYAEPYTFYQPWEIAQWEAVAKWDAAHLDAAAAAAPPAETDDDVIRRSHDWLHETEGGPAVKRRPRRASRSRSRKTKQRNHRRSKTPKSRRR